MAAASEPQRSEQLLAYLVRQAAEVLHVPAGELNAEEPLTFLGLDSLMALELRNRIESDLQLNVPVTQLLTGTSVHDLQQMLAASFAVVRTLRRTAAGAGRSGAAAACGGTRSGGGTGTAGRDVGGEHRPAAPGTARRRRVECMSQEPQPSVPTALSAAGLSLADKRALAERLLQKKAGAAGTRYPLSYSQRAMWFMHELDPHSSAYHVAFAARICSGVDVPALERAVQRLVDRHPALRTTFANGDEGPVQVVARNRPAGFLHIVLAGADEDALRGEVLAAYAEPFDLETGPLLRVTLFTRPASPSTAGDHLLLIVAHHIIWDGWSVAITLNELMAIYAAEVQAQEQAEKVSSRPMPSVLGPAPAAHYADYVAWQHEMLAGPEGARLWSYWRAGAGRAAAGAGAAHQSAATGAANS